MKINAKVNLINNDSKMKGVADIVLDDVFVIKGIRVMEGQNGAFVSMPSQKVGSEYRETVFPITAKFREQLMGSVLSAYEQKLQEGLENEEKEKQDSEKNGKGKSKKQAHDRTFADKQTSESAPEDNQEVDEGMSGMGGM
ncbi:MAG: putative septation protein SpoVG [Firmicutes bacterium ADurb.Bin193]|nr:MAG: putative septation protein SpoVG [Firmicutes bacterium ADurb.Bin193]